MKILFIICVVYLVIAVVAFIVQSLISVYSDLDQSSIGMKIIIKQSFKWPIILIQIIWGLIS